MKIDDDHLYHGAALLQIAEHPQLTAINQFKIKNDVVRNVFDINHRIAVHLKYSQNPKGRLSVYQFTFTQEHLQMLKDVSTIRHKLVIALVCGDDRQICALPYEKLKALIGRRLRDADQEREDEYAIRVTLPNDGWFHVDINAVGKKRTNLGVSIKIACNRFPGSLFR